ncbi:MAG: hypothetical protein FWG79_05510 [Bacteroidales bacterium]|nr:hypothetical protein [Bacteroidales bacterium]
MKTTSIIHLTFIILACLSFSSALKAENGQETLTNIFLRTSPIKDKITVKLSNSINTGVYTEKKGSTLNMHHSPFSLRLSNFRAEGNYGLLSCLEVGAYFGFSDMGRIRISDAQGIQHSYLLNFGGQVNFHPLGLFLNESRNRWDLWFGYKYGYAVEYGFFEQSFFENGLGFGLSFFPFKKQNIGFHFEYNTGDWGLKKVALSTKRLAHDFRWGICYKFRE